MTIQYRTMTYLSKHVLTLQQRSSFPMIYRFTFVVLVKSNMFTVPDILVPSKLTSVHPVKSHWFVSHKTAPSSIFMTAASALQFYTSSFNLWIHYQLLKWHCATLAFVMPFLSKIQGQSSFSVQNVSLNPYFSGSCLSGANDRVKWEGTENSDPRGLRFMIHALNHFYHGSKYCLKVNFPSSDLMYHSKL